MWNLIVVCEDLLYSDITVVLKNLDKYGHGWGSLQLDRDCRNTSTNSNDLAGDSSVNDGVVTNVRIGGLGRGSV